MLDSELLNILRCPVTSQRLKQADHSLVERVNQMISSKQLRDASGGLVDQSVQGLLVTEDNSTAHAIRLGIPTLIPGESINLSQLNSTDP